MTPASRAGWDLNGWPLVGFSQGACVACEFVLRHPQRCRALIMFTGSIIGTDALPWLAGGSRGWTAFAY